MVSQRDGVIAELGDKACTLWASGWISFQRKEGRVFPGLDLNFQVPGEEEAEEFISEDEADPGMSSDAPSTIHFEVPLEVGFPTSPVGALPPDSHGSTARSPAPDI